MQIPANFGSFFGPGQWGQWGNSGVAGGFDPARLPQIPPMQPAPPMAGQSGYGWDPSRIAQNMGGQQPMPAFRGGGMFARLFGPNRNTGVTGGWSPQGDLSGWAPNGRPPSAPPPTMGGAFGAAMHRFF